jgi:hypothetical protein
MLKEFLRAVLPGSWYAGLRNAWVDARDWREWRAHRRHPRVPPPHVVKVRTVLDCARRHGIRTLVETGTFEGEMVRKCRRRFDAIHTIELSPEWAERAEASFANDAHVYVHRGDSAEVLPRVLEGIRDRVVLWLDGHYSGEGTARGTSDTPLLAELEAVRRHGQRGSVVLIDDARCLGTTGYPALAEVQARLRAIEPDALITLADDIVRAEPRLAGAR